MDAGWCAAPVCTKKEIWVQIQERKRETLWWLKEMPLEQGFKDLYISNGWVGGAVKNGGEVTQEMI